MYHPRDPRRQTAVYGDQRNDLLNKHFRSSPPSLEGINANVTSEFSQLVRRCFRKNVTHAPNRWVIFSREFRMMRVFKLTPSLNLCKNPAPEPTKHRKWSVASGQWLADSGQ